MQTYWLLFLLLLVAQAVKAQTGSSFLVNPDGTHTVVYHNGNTAIAINPDGTHSHIFRNGNTSIQVNADGTHSPIFHNGTSSIRVNPDGTHSVFIHNESSSRVVNPNGFPAIFHWFGKRKHKKSNKDRKATLSPDANRPPYHRSSPQWHGCVGF
jgi:hypothetical protein